MPDFKSIGGKWEQVPNPNIPVEAPDVVDIKQEIKPEVKEVKEVKKKGRKPRAK